MNYNNIKEMKENGRFGKVMLGLESSYFYSNFRYGIEEIIDELEAGSNENPNVGDNVELTLEQIPSKEETPKPEDIVNIVSIFGDYNNKYRETITKIMGLDKLVVSDGSFSKSEMYKDTAKEVKRLLDIVFGSMDNDRKSLYLDFIRLDSIVSNKWIMTKLAGKVDEPFIGEGLQLLYLSNLAVLLALIPFSVKYPDKSIPELIELAGCGKVSKLFDITRDVIGMESKLGDKIYFVETERSVISNKPMDNTTGTVYETMANDQGSSSYVTSNESIANFLIIRNNGAIVELSLLIKGLLLLVKSLEFVKLSNMINDLQDKIQKLLEGTSNAINDGVNGEDYIESILEWSRVNVLMLLDSKIDGAQKELEGNPQPEVDLSNGEVKNEYRGDNVVDNTVTAPSIDDLF